MVSGRVAIPSGSKVIGSVTAVESPVPGVTGSISTVNPVIQVQGAFGGSTRGRLPGLARRLCR